MKAKFRWALGLGALAIIAGATALLLRSEKDAPEDGAMQTKQALVPELDRSITVADLGNGRLAVHAPPRATPRSVDEMLRAARVPGLVSVAGEIDTVTPELSEKEIARRRAIHEARQQYAADVAQLRNTYKNERRKLKDPNAPKNGRRFGKNRELAKELRQAYKKAKRDVSLGGPDAAQGSMPKFDEVVARLGAENVYADNDERKARGGRGDGSGGGRR